MKHRQERTEEAIREAVSEIVLREVKDPRMPGIFNVSRVSITPDLQLAKIYFTQLPEDDEAIDETLAALERASGFIRHALGGYLTMRRMPQLRFYYDEQDRSTRRIEELLKEARKTSARPEGESSREDDPRS